MNDLKELLIGFGIPAILIIGSMILLLSGIDGEVKVILAMAAAWTFRSATQRVKK
ncbi:hypothetical protein ES703_39340 [subsurface metagenome]